MELLYPTRKPHVTQHFGVSTKVYGLGGHRGLDFRLRNDPESHVLAAQSGKVVYVNSGVKDWYVLKNGKWVATSNCKKGSSYGNHIIIDHGGYFTLYAHLKEIKVEFNQIVEAGKLIGIGGNTGFSKGAHLHFELRTEYNIRSKTVNPLPYLVSELDDGIPEWGRNAWEWSQKNNLINMKSGFSDKLSKGELAVILNRFIKLVTKTIK